MVFNFTREYKMAMNADLMGPVCDIQEIKAAKKDFKTKMRIRARGKQGCLGLTASEYEAQGMPGGGNSHRKIGRKCPDHSGRCNATIALNASGGREDNTDD